MGSCYAKKAVDFAIDQIGNSCGKTNIYSEQLDAVGYFNTEKNGYADSCSIFVNACIYNACIDPSAENDPEGAKWTSLYMMYEPSSGNAAAGCTQAANYFKSNGAFYTDPKDFERGDQIFFKRSDGALYHTGIIVDWDEDGIYTVEGNTNGGMVAKKFYEYSSSKIAGVGRPRYDGWEIPSVSAPVASDDENKEDYTEIIDRLAHEVLEGKYGNYPRRKQLINGLGYGNIYGYVQKRVNELLYR